MCIHLACFLLDTHYNIAIMKATLRTTLDKDLADRAKMISKERGVSISALIERSLDRYLDFLIARENGSKRELETPVR